MGRHWGSGPSRDGAVCGLAAPFPESVLQVPLSVFVWSKRFAKTIVPVDKGEHLLASTASHCDLFNATVLIYRNWIHPLCLS